MISGNGLPRFNQQEDTCEVAVNAILCVTGISVQKDWLVHVHRHGKHGERIFARYVTWIYDELIQYFFQIHLLGSTASNSGTEAQTSSPPKEDFSRNLPAISRSEAVCHGTENERRGTNQSSVCEK